MPKIPTALVAASSLIGGYVTARATKVRATGGGVLALGGVWCARRWWRRSGPFSALLLSAIYLAGFGGSHPLAKRIGAWPSVLSVAGVSALASWLVSDRRH